MIDSIMHWLATASTESALWLIVIVFIILDVFLGIMSIREHFQELNRELDQEFNRELDQEFNREFIRELDRDTNLDFLKNKESKTVDNDNSN